MSPPVLIVGGGLAGLTAARLLHREGIGFQILEARDRLGGRILSLDASATPSADGVDLGPAWFWPALQPGLATLVDELGVSIFPQHDEGDIILQRTDHEAPRRYLGQRQESPSVRVVGGAGALISALATNLPGANIQLNARVTQARLVHGGIELRVVETCGLEHRVRASQVIFALPPRLLAATVTFLPALEEPTVQRWRATPTWMAPHAKIVVLYNRTFWRDDHLSGTAQSWVGPLVEIHDATTASGTAALFGFLGVPSWQRTAVGRDALVTASLRQLAALFGPEAATPLATLYKDWAADPLTATTDDQLAGDHPVRDRRPWIGGVWHKHVLLAGSETSSTEPGYLAGAVQAAERAVSDLIDRMAEPSTSPSS